MDGGNCRVWIFARGKTTVSAGEEKGKRVTGLTGSGLLREVEMRRAMRAMVPTMHSRFLCTIIGERNGEFPDVVIHHTPTHR